MYAAHATPLRAPGAPTSHPPSLAHPLPPLTHPPPSSPPSPCTQVLPTGLDLTKAMGKGGPGPRRQPPGIFPIEVQIR